MTKWALLLTAWYTLMSEDGHWGYKQTFGWFDTQAACEEMANNEAKAAAEFSVPFRSITPMEPRRMLLYKMTYTCITDNELADIYRKENEKYDN